MQPNFELNPPPKVPRRVLCVCALVDRKQLQAALALACVGGIFALRILYFLNLFEKVVKRLLSCQT